MKIYMYVLIIPPTNEIRDGGILETADGWTVSW